MLYGNNNTYANANNYAQGVQSSGFGWDTQAVINDEYNTQSGEGYINLKPGYYDAVIDYVEKGMHGNTGKIGICPQATIHAHVDTQEGKVEIKDTLFLHPSCAAGLQFFFTSCGIDMKGKSYGALFAEAEGKVARVEIQDRPYTGSDGTQKVYHNDIKRWVRPRQQTAPTGSYQAYTAPQQPQVNNQPLQPQQAPQQPYTAPYGVNAPQEEPLPECLSVSGDDLPF